MYIKINDVKGEKRIDISYSIKNFDFAETAVVSLFSDNVQCQILKLRSVMDPISNAKEMIPTRTYVGSPC